MIKEGQYHFAHVHFLTGTDPSKKWTGWIELTSGGFYDGRLNFVTLNTRYSPIPHLAFSGNVQRYSLKNVGVYKSSADYYLYTAQTRISLSPRLQTFFLYQKNTVTKSDGINAKFSWEYKPLSYVYLVYNNRAWTENNINDRNSQAIFKLSYLKQF